MIDLVFPKEDETDSTPMDVKVESSRDESQDANVSWKVVAGSCESSVNCCELRRNHP